MVQIEMTSQEMRRYLKYFRGEEDCPYEYQRNEVCWQAESMIAGQWKSLTDSFVDGLSPDGRCIEQCIIDWVTDYITRHCPNDYEEELQKYLAGKYFKHFKGRIYRNESLAKDSETQEVFVVYKAMYDDGQTWIRPVTSFMEIVERDGVPHQRFQPITDEDAIASIPYHKRRNLGIMRVLNGVVRPDFTPDRITELKDDEVFVFGSNLSGMHGGGAAFIAFKKFGAVMGCGIGHRGQSYAIPTMQGGIETIKPYVDEFIGYARQHPDLFFYVTRIGCGIAGFKDNEIAPLFSEARDIENICLPESFLKYI